MKGIIMKGIAGVYLVSCGKEFFECTACGRFRKEKIKPLVGDYVEFSENGDQTGRIDLLYERSSTFVRPPVANINQLIITFAVTSPEPDLSLVDKMLVTAEKQGIAAAVCITKQDLDDADFCRRYAHIYESAHYQVVMTSTEKGSGLAELAEITKGKITAFAGCSGVGKSSVLNAFNGHFALKTGEISRKIERGKHTTRHVELLPLVGGGFVLDTPGFSTVELPDMGADELADCFPEIAEHSEGCRFRDCAHLVEPGCNVLKAVEDGLVCPERHAHYQEFYKELKQKKAW